MNLAMINSRAEVGVQSPPVKVEVHLAGGLPGLTLVGLPATAVREARDRVRAALQTSGFKLPPRRITVNLAPADLPKDGARFDLAIALGILQASGQLQVPLEDMEFIGELSLSGELRPVTGVLPAVMAAKQAGHRIVVPRDNSAEALLPEHAKLQLASNLLQVCNALNGQANWPEAKAPPGDSTPLALPPDLAEVRGQHLAKRALEIAACGRHNLLMHGPPGSGKSMLAQRITGLCPALTAEESLELAAVHSAIQAAPDWRNWRRVPFRSPHHSASAAALIGGGSKPRPGEISMAHFGVLFLDELPEFKRSVLEVLREPLETGQVHISRANHRLSFPSRFQLIAAMNPCPCGYLGDSSGHCHCSSEAVARYQARVSGPLLDRIDLHVSVPRLAASDMLGQATQTPPSSAEVAQRVTQARARQLTRRGKPNNELSAAELEQDCQLAAPGHTLLEQAADRMQLSGRAIHRVLKVARSIADLADNDGVTTQHLAEALTFRPATTT